MKTLEINLFGEMQEMDWNYNKPKGYAQKWKASNGYRLGTKEQSCQTCQYVMGMEYHGKVYYKCFLLGDSNSEKTDIRLKNVCNKYTKEDY